MEQLQQIQNWYNALAKKEQWSVVGTTLLIIITLFFLIVWEPLHLGLKTEQQTQNTQNKSLIWMQQAANEVKSLRRSGVNTTSRDKNKPTTLVIEQTIKNAGLKANLSKIESSGNNGARVTLTNASFNQILIWLNTLSTHNGIFVNSANIERTSTAGKTNAKLTFERP